MLGFLHSIFDYLAYIIGSLANYIDMLHVYFSFFFVGLKYVWSAYDSFIWSIPLPLKALAVFFFSVAIARLCVNLGGH